MTISGLSWRTGYGRKWGYGHVMDIKSVPMAHGRGVSDEDIDELLKSENVVSRS